MTKQSDLVSINGLDVASGDTFLVLDISDNTMGAGGTNKQISKSELQIAVAGVISGSTIDNSIIGGTTPAAGNFTTLSSTGTTTLGPTTITGSGTATATLGSDLITNGDFTGNATGWTLGADWAYGVDNVVLTNDGGSGTLSQNITVENGKLYYVSWSQTSSIANNASITPSIGSVSGFAVSPDDTLSSSQYQIIAADTTGSVAFALTPTNITTTGTVTIDDVIVKEITAYIPTSVIKGTAADTLPIEIRGNEDLGNVYIGLDSGELNTTGGTNTAVGGRSLSSNTTGYSNTSIGSSSMKSNTTGLDNTSVGRSSMFRNTSGWANTSMGVYSLYSSSSGKENVSCGYQSMYENIFGYDNSALGSYALRDNTTGKNNTSVGHSALRSNVSGTNNSAVGYGAGRYYGAGSDGATTCSNSVYVGFQTRASANGNTNEIVVGYDVVGLGSNTTSIGTSNTTRTKLYGTVETSGYTVATLPAAGVAGRRAYVTDATAPTFLGTLTGGGAVVCPVFDNGTAWVAG